MIRVKPGKSDKVIGFEVNGKLLHDDYKIMIPRLEELLAEHNSIRCYIEITNLHGFELRALWDEIKFDTKHCKQVERCAVVGDPSWHHWMTKFGQFMFGRADVKYFSSEEAATAWEWLEEGLPSSQIGTGAESETTAGEFGSQPVESAMHADR